LRDVRLEKNVDNKQTTLPYELDAQLGDHPRSSRKVRVFMRGGEQKVLDLHDYISIPPPRTSHRDIAIRMVSEQHGLTPGAIIGLDFFHDKKFGKYK